MIKHTFSILLLLVALNIASFAAEENDDGFLLHRGEARVEELILPQHFWPAPENDYISYGFGSRIHPLYGYWDFHNGIDILGDWDDAIVAAAAGEVIYAGWMSGYGNCVILRHKDGYETLYAHGNSVEVEYGQKVFAEDVIMLMGSSGISTAVHLHFEVRENGEWINPIEYLD